MRAVASRQLEARSEAHADVPQRGPLELFELPMVFSQAPLLTADEFRRELDRRGLWPMQLGQLEELHRTPLLQPLFRVLRDVRGAKAAARPEGRSPLDYLIYTPTVGSSGRTRRPAI